MRFPADMAETTYNGEDYLMLGRDAEDEPLRIKLKDAIGHLFIDYIKPTDPAPTPARNGNYTFSIGGNKPAWLTAEAGITTVKAGDGVSVVYTAPSTYSYTHVDVNSEVLQKTAQTLTDAQKLQVRTNIGAADDSRIAGLISTNYVSVDNYASFGHDDATFTNELPDFMWFERIPSTQNGILSNFKLPNFTGSNLASKIYVIGSNNIIKSITDVTLTAITTDLTSHNIAISVGDYLGFYTATLTSFLKYSSGGVYGMVNMPKTCTIGQTVPTPSGAELTRALAYYWTVKYVVTTEKKANKDEVITFDNIVSQPGESETNLINQKKYTTDLYVLKSTSLFYGHDTTSGTLVIYSTWVEFNAITKSGTLKTFKLPSFTGSVYDAKIVVVGSNNVIKSVTDVTLSGVTTDLSTYNIDVAIGDYVGIYSSEITKFLKYSGSGSGMGLATASITPVVGGSITPNGSATTWSLNYYFEIVNSVYESKFELLPKRVSFNTSKSLVITGSSLTESVVVPNGFGWIERLNDLMDIPIVNAALGGKDLVYNMWMLANDIALPHDSGNTIKGCNPQFIMWLNSANGTPIGENAITQLRAAKMLTESLGAKMIVGTEEFWYENGYNHDAKVQSFSELENVPYSAITKLFKMLYPTYVYSGFVYAGHSGYRAQSAYLAHYDDLLFGLIPKQSIKAYRVRPLYKSGSPVISDLSYNNRLERFKKYYAISAGNNTGNAITTAGIDNLDDHSYDVTNGINTGISISETSVFLRGGNLSFTGFALLEFILSDININNATITFNCSVQPDSIYIQRKKESNLTSTTFSEPSTEFESVSFDYTNGMVTMVLDNQIQIYDKTSILIAKTGTFNINSPEIIYYGGFEKQINQLTRKERKFGTEIQTYHDMTNGGWSLNGSASLKSFPSVIAQYPAYNSANSHIELPNDTSYITKTIAISQPCTKVAIRIVAQNFIKIATTRYNSDSDVLNSGYIANDTPQTSPYDYDYGEIYIKANTAYLTKKIITQGWTECYLEIPIYADTTSLVLEIGRKNHIDSNYSNENSIVMINDISVQKLN